MRLKKLVWASAAVLLAVILTSCNIGKSPEPTPDVNGIYTAAAQTMVAGLNAQQTQTAGAASPTPQASPTPLVSPTTLATFAISTGSIPFGTPFTLGTPPTPLGPTLPAGTGLFSFPVGCDDAMYLGETKPKDGAQLAPSKLFDKGWSLQNVGTCTWDEGYTFAFKDGERFSVDNPNISILAKDEFTAPGHSQTFIFHMTAPKQQGEYRGYWQMRNDAGTWFGSIVYVDIIVVREGADTPTPKATP